MKSKIISGGKYLLYFYLFTWVGLMLFPSCNGDFDDVSGDENTRVSGWMSIQLSEQEEGVTYGTMVDNVAEYNVQNLAVYMFEDESGDYKLKKIFSDDKGNIEYKKGQYKAQYIRLNVDGCTSGTKRFVIVANVNGVGQVQSDALKSISDRTTLSDFLNLVVSSASENSAVFLTSIVKNDLGLPMTASQTGSPYPYVEVVLNVVMGTNVYGVSLTRRVARIDIINGGDTNFTLEKVLLKGAPASGYLCNVENTVAVGAGEEEELDVAGLIKKGSKYSFYVFPGAIISEKGNDSSDDAGPMIVLSGKRQEYYPLKNSWDEKIVRFSPARPETNDLVAIANGQYNLTIPAYDGGLDIYLCIGQSNMAGFGQQNGQYWYPTDKIPGAYLFKNKDGQVWEEATNPLNRYSTTNTSGYLSLAYNFAKEMRKYYPNRAVGLVHNAHGGTNLHTQWKAWIGTHFVLTELRMAEVTATKTGVVRGILWHQGESDSTEPYRSAYMKNFIDFVDAWRTILNNPDLPVVAGEIISAYSDNQRLWNEMFQSAPEQIPMMALVSHEGTFANSDKIHFDVASLDLLGERYAVAMKELLEKKEGPTTKATESCGVISLPVEEYK